MRKKCDDRKDRGRGKRPKKPECPKRTHEVVLNRDVAVSCPRQRVFTPVANAIIKKYRAL